MEIRCAVKADYEKIHDLVKAAFQSAEISDGQEQQFVRSLREKEGYIPELELVMEEDGELAAHIMFTELTIVTAEGNKTALLVAPLCVRDKMRNQGFGGALLRDGFARAASMNYRAAFIVGNPDYYERFGFKQTEKFGIKNESGFPDCFVLGCEIIPGSLRNVKGKIGKLG